MTQSYTIVINTIICLADIPSGSLGRRSGVDVIRITQLYMLRTWCDVDNDGAAATSFSCRHLPDADDPECDGFATTTMTTTRRERSSLFDGRPPVNSQSGRLGAATGMMSTYYCLLCTTIVDYMKYLRRHVASLRSTTRAFDTPCRIYECVSLWLPHPSKGHTHRTHAMKITWNI